MGGVESRDARIKHKLEHAMAVGSDFCLDTSQQEIPVDLITTKALNLFF